MPNLFSFLPFNIETSVSVFTLLFFLLPLTPFSSSLWRDSPMSFKMASVKPLATQKGTNRCPCSFFQLASFFFYFFFFFFADIFLSSFLSSYLFHLFTTGMSVSSSTATTGVWSLIFSLCGWFELSLFLQICLIFFFLNLISVLHLSSYLFYLIIFCSLSI